MSEIAKCPCCGWVKEAARALLADLDAHASGSMGDTQDALVALVGEG